MAHQRSPARRRAIAVIGGATLALIGGFGVASAAQLSVTSDEIGVETNTRCDDGTLSVTVVASGGASGQTAVVVSGYGAACNGLTFEVGLERNNTNLYVEGSGTCGASPCTITMPSYDGRRVGDAHVIIDTWGVPADWTATCYNPPGPTPWQCEP